MYIVTVQLPRSVITVIYNSDSVRDFGPLKVMTHRGLRVVDLQQFHEAECVNHTLMSTTY